MGANMTETYVVENLTEAEADRVIRLYDRCSTTKSQQDDGKWKVVAICPDSVVEE